MIKKFKCKDCGKTVENKDGTIPKCCGKPMKQLPLDVCMQPAHAENARLMNDDEPCDDGRAG
jgi:transposase-like protein